MKAIAAVGSPMPTTPFIVPDIRKAAVAIATVVSVSNPGDPLAGGRTGARLRLSLFLRNASTATTRSGRLSAGCAVRRQAGKLRIDIGP